MHKAKSIYVKREKCFKKQREKQMWVEFIEQFPYVIQHKQGKTNVVIKA